MSAAYLCLATRYTVEDAVEHARSRGLVPPSARPLTGSVAAVSVGIVDGRPVLDLCYDEDVSAGTDMNIVMTGDGRYVEVQGTAEGEAFDRALLDALLDLGAVGCAELTRLQAAALEATGETRP